MLIDLRYLEVVENENENKDIVDAQGFLNQETRQEFEPRLDPAFMEEYEPNVEKQC